MTTQPTSPPPDAQFLRAFADAWNAHDIDVLMSFMSADCEFHAVGGPELLGRSFVGPQAVREGFATPTRVPNSKHRRRGWVAIQGPGSGRGVVFRKHALLPWLSVMENTEFGLRLQVLRPGLRRQRRELFRPCRPADGREDRRQKEQSIRVAHLQLAAALSERDEPGRVARFGGMQQREGIARALTCNPAMLLMTNPWPRSMR